MKETISPQAINKMFELDFCERKISTEHGYSQDDQLFLTKVNNGLGKVQGHYEVPLPFRETAVNMPNNKSQAEQRILQMKWKFSKNSRLHSEYTNFMNDLLAKKYARKVTNDFATPGKGKVWYLPHHAVYHPKKPNKVRVVFDCSARFEGVSLNDRLLQGPDLTSSLIGVLLRFRQEQYAFTGDIESMFYQVTIPENQRDFVRFLWLPDGDLSKELVKY